MRYSDPDVRTFWSDLRVNSPLQFDHKLYDSTKREQWPQSLGHQRASTSIVSQCPKETSQRTIRLLLHGVSVDNCAKYIRFIIQSSCSKFIMHQTQKLDVGRTLHYGSALCHATACPNYQSYGEIRHHHSGLAIASKLSQLKKNMLESCWKYKAWPNLLPF